MKKITESKAIELLTKAYNPYQTIIQQHKAVNKVVAALIEDGWNKENVYKVVDISRKNNGLSEIKRK